MERADGRPLLVASLSGHAPLDIALLCLGSRRRSASAPMRFRRHDDGSPTAADEERLRAAFGDVEIVRRREADERVETALAR